MIPKKIHYCWFGGNPLPPLAEKCMASWERYCPDYQIIRWDESNYDCSKHPYMRKAYARKKFAFVADYARMDIVYNHGGIYLDTDVELLKNLDDFLDNDFYIGFEKSEYINSGLGLGATQGHAVLKDFLDKYDSVVLTEDFSFTPCPMLESKILQDKYNLKNDTGDIQYLTDDITIYPQEFFCPLDEDNNGSISKNTVSIHHFSATWVPWHWKFMRFVEKRSQRLLGPGFTEMLRKAKRIFIPPPKA